MNINFSHPRSTFIISIASVFLCVQASGMKLEFTDPYDDKGMRITYEGDDFDVREFRWGKAPIVTWRRDRFNYETERTQCQNRIDNFLSSLRKELGKPMVEGNFVTLTDVQLRAKLEENIDFPRYPYSFAFNYQIDKVIPVYDKWSDAYRAENDFYYYLQKLAILSWSTPFQAREIEFNSYVRKIISQVATIASLATAFPLQEKLQEVQKEERRMSSYFVEYHTKYTDASKKLADSNKIIERKNTECIKLQGQMKNLNEELETLKDGVFQAIYDVDELEEKVDFYNKYSDTLLGICKSEQKAHANTKQDLQQVSSQLTLLQERANQVSPLRRQLEEKDKEIEDLKRKLAQEMKRNSYASVVRGEHLKK